MSDFFPAVTVTARRGRNGSAATNGLASGTFSPRDFGLAFARRENDRRGEKFCVSDAHGAKGRDVLDIDLALALASDKSRSRGKKRKKKYNASMLERVTPNDEVRALLRERERRLLLPSSLPPAASLSSLPFSCRRWTGVAPHNDRCEISRRIPRENYNGRVV